MLPQEEMQETSITETPQTSLQMTAEAQQETRLYQEIKKTMDQVRALYRQMKAQAKGQSDDAQDSDQ